MIFWNVIYLICFLFGLVWGHYFADYSMPIFISSGVLNTNNCEINSLNYNNNINQNRNLWTINNDEYNYVNYMSSSIKSKCNSNEFNQFKYLNKKPSYDIIESSNWNDIKKTFNGYWANPSWKDQMKSGFILKHNNMNLNNLRKENENEWDQCKYVDLYILVSNKPKECVAIIEQEHDNIGSNVHKFDEDLSPHKLIPRPEPSIKDYSLASESYQLLMKNIKDIEIKLKPLLEKISKDNKIVISCVNEGDIDLILNYYCSTKANQIDISNFIVFASDENVKNKLTALGINSFYHPGFGVFPKTFAKVYGDNTFSLMMWLKMVSVYVPLRMGYDVLFQDADLIWWKDPWPYFEQSNMDMYFQDDGARSVRFSPTYANSGFYFIRSTPETLRWSERFIGNSEQVYSSSSHQTILDRTTAEHFNFFGMTIKVLDIEDFPSGKMYWHRKDYIKSIIDGEFTPYIFHLCWTRSKIEKIENFKASNWWYLSDSCTERSILTTDISMSSCCIVP